MSKPPIIFKGDYAQLLTAKGLEFFNNGRYNIALTLAEAKALKGTVNHVIYCVANQCFYQYCATCTETADDDFLLITGDGGDTRWERIEKVSHTFGDTGWIDRTNCSIARTGAGLDTLTLTVATGGAFYAVKGKRYELAAGTFDNVPTGTAGARYFYLDTAGTLKSSDSFFDFLAQVPVAFAQWSGTAISFEPATEFHGLRDIIWHYYAHRFQGAQYLSGLTFTSNSQADNNSNPADDTVSYLWSTSGVIYDEDTEITVGTGAWAQTLGSGLTSANAAIIPFLYYDGTSIAAVAAMADRTPFIHAGGNTLPQWNNGGTLQASASGNYVVYHYFASPLVNGYSVFARPHNAVFGSLSTALTANPATLSWSGFPSAECKHLYTAVFRVSSAFTNSTHRAKLVSLQSFRLVAGTPVAGISATDHNALSNRNAPASHPAYAIASTVRTVTASEAMTVTDTVILLNHASTPIVLTLLPASGSNRGPITIKRIGAAASSIDADSSETIDGALTLALPALNSSVTIESDGTAWYVRSAYLPFTESGTYAPTFTGVGNITGTPTASADWTWMRVGNVVTVSGVVTATLTSTGNTDIGISLPIPSAMTNNYCGSGSGAFINGGTATAGWTFYMDATNDRANLRCSASPASGSKDIGCIFQYPIL